MRFLGIGDESVTDLVRHQCHHHDIYTVDDLNGHPILWVCEICEDAKVRHYLERQKEIDLNDRNRTQRNAASSRTDTSATRR